MTRHLILGLSLLTALSTFGASHIDPTARVRIAADTEVTGWNTLLRDHGSRGAQERPPYQPMILQIADDATLDSLSKYEVIVYNQRGDLVLTSIPYENLYTVLALDGVINGAASGDMSSMMDRARPFGHVDAVQQWPAGDSSTAVSQGSVTVPCGYDGEGVVVGFADIGFDPHHITFEGRIAQVWDFDTEQGLVRSATTPEEIKDWRVDTDAEYHATHVAGILAGGYKGNDYYGVATGAEIVGTTSRLHDVGILAGVERIIDYAKQRGSRCVVNISMANYLGAHDGTSLMCQYLSRCAEDATICISAGNSGKSKIFAYQDLNKSEGQVTLNCKPGYDGFVVKGYAEIWSQSEQAFEFSIGVWDTDAQQVIYNTPWLSGELSGKISAESDEGWAQYFTGAIYIESGVANTNGHYMVAIAADTETTPVSQAGPWSRYYTVLCTRRLAESKPAPTVNYFADWVNLYFGQLPNWPTKVSSDGTINDMVTAPDIISVGMAASRVTAPNVRGGEFVAGGEVGTVSVYSAYSDAPTLPRLPVITGPGWYVVSSLNRAYVMRNINCEVSATAKVDRSTYYWGPTGGTSMSSPFVAGVCALWLQADPTLTNAEIIDIMQSTAQRDYSDISDPRWGAGCIDAEAGLRAVLARTGIVDPQSYVTVSVGADRHILVEGTDISQVRVYDSSGISVNPHAALTPGLYIVAIPGGQTRKVICR